MTEDEIKELEKENSIHVKFTSMYAHSYSEMGKTGTCTVCFYPEKYHNSRMKEKEMEYLKLKNEFDDVKDKKDVLVWRHFTLENGILKIIKGIENKTCNDKDQIIKYLEDLILKSLKHYYVDGEDNQPCPSCKGKNTRYDNSDNDEPRIYENVICDDCGHGT